MVHDIFLQLVIEHFIELLLEFSKQNSDGGKPFGDAYNGITNPRKKTRWV